MMIDDPPHYFRIAKPFSFMNYQNTDLPLTGGSFQSIVPYSPNHALVADPNHLRCCRVCALSSND